jgi:hypothetical protein
MTACGAPNAGAPPVLSASVNGAEAPSLTDAAPGAAPETSAPGPAPAPPVAASPTASGDCSVAERLLVRARWQVDETGDDTGTIEVTIEGPGGGAFRRERFNGSTWAVEWSGEGAVAIGADLGVAHAGLGGKLPLTQVASAHAAGQGKSAKTPLSYSFRPGDHARSARIAFPTQCDGAAPRPRKLSDDPSTWRTPYVQIELAWSDADHPIDARAHDY